MVSISKLLNTGFLLASQSIFGKVATPQQASTEQYNVIKFLGGSAPYIQHPGFGISPDIPDQCTVEQAHLMLRHGERYPSKAAGKGYEAIMAKINDYNETFVGQLAIFNDYTYFVLDPSYYDKETTPWNSEGTYAGVVTAARHGNGFRAKYKNLFNSSTETLKVFTSNSGRCHVTAINFARGFLGDEYTDKAVEYYVIDEDKKMGANSLTPRDGCAGYNQTLNNQIVKKFNTSYLDGARARLLKGNEKLNLTTSDVYQMFQWCAFELNVKGKSPICDLFTNEEFIQYSYSFDLAMYYTFGPGNNMTAVIGVPYLKATVKFLKEENPDYKIVLGFTHDSDIEMYISTLGLLNPLEALPTDHVPFPNPYQHSQIVPQGARLVTEKLSCNGESYVRFLLNDAVYPLQTCQSGPGFSCKLSDFESYVESRINGLSYRDQCKVQTPDEVTFLWDYKTGNYTAADIDL